MRVSSALSVTILLLATNSCTDIARSPLEPERHLRPGARLGDYVYSGTFDASGSTAIDLALPNSGTPPGPCLPAYTAARQSATLYVKLPDGVTYRTVTIASAGLFVLQTSNPLNPSQGTYIWPSGYWPAVDGSGIEVSIGTVDGVCSWTFTEDSHGNPVLNFHFSGQVFHNVNTRWQKKPPAAKLDIDGEGASYDATVSTGQGVDVTLDGSLSVAGDASITSYDWYADGSYVGSGVSLDYYATNESTDISLVVTDENGLSSSASGSIDLTFDNSCGSTELEYDEFSDDPSSGDCASPNNTGGGGGGGGSSGSNCDIEYVYIDISYDGGLTWQEWWEGYATVCS